MNFSQSFLNLYARAIAQTQERDIEKMAHRLADVRQNGGRVFLVGSGGGAGHASHATCDFRKLCNIEAYAPYDNVSELTARVNDEGWDVTLLNWLKVSRFNKNDCIFVFSVGGGDFEKQISANIVKAVQYAKEIGASVVGVVGKDGGYTKKSADAVVVVPTVDQNLITPITESFQAMIWHLLVSHPVLQVNPTKWESVTPTVGQEGSKVKTKLFADGANKEAILALYRNPLIDGFTTNPTLMKKAGVKDYKQFALDILASIKDKPISFEVFADDFPEMERQAKEIASWGANVYVKIPITNTKRQSSAALIGRLARAGVKMNVTAILTVEQVKEVLEQIKDGPPSYVSVFAGRIADTGIDPMPIMQEVLDLIRPYPQIELIWASPRELLNIEQARAIGCHIITATDDVLKKLPLIGKDLGDFSLETVKMFYDDAQSAGYTIEPTVTLPGNVQAPPIIVG